MSRFRAWFPFRGHPIFKESFQILLVPESGSEILQFRLSHRCIIRTLAIGGVTALLLGASIGAFRSAIARGYKLARVSGQNVALRAELDQLGGMIEVLGETMARNAADAEHARALAGITDLLHDEAPLGLGGSNLGMDETGDPSQAFGDPALRRLTLAAEVELDSLMRESGSRRQTYERVLDVLRERKKDLDHLPSIHPLGGKGWYSSGFGHRSDPFTGLRAFHSGLDVSAHKGTPVLATANGVVKKVGKDRFFGHAVRIDHGNGVETVYAHNSETLVRRGERVERGDEIARVGSTGRSTGPHLHYAVIVNGEPVNPLAYILPDDVVVD